MARRSTAWRGVLPLAIAVLVIILFAMAIVLGVLDHRVPNVLPGLSPVAFAVVGAVILGQRPDNRIGWLLCAGAVPLAILNTGTEYAYRSVAIKPLPATTTVEVVINLMPLLGIGILVPLLPQLFPTGAPISPRWRWPVWAAWGFIVTGVVGNAVSVEKIQDLPDVTNPIGVPAAAGIAGGLLLFGLGCLVVSLVAAVASLVVRWRRAVGDQRQQIKWFLAGIVPVFIPIALHDAYPIVAGFFIALLLTLIPITIGIAVLRYHLYDLDIVLNRVLVYTVLSAITAAVYLAVVVTAEVVAGWGRGIGVQIAATVIAAALFQPLRQRVQSGVDRMFFGDRSRPYEALTRLGVQLEHATVPEDMLRGVVATVAEALRVPYAAIEFLIGEDIVVAAEHGRMTSAPTRFAMAYQGETIGYLAVSRRGPTEDFGVADRRLLADLARQAGVAAHASRVTTALQQARLALITAREEERRRLRRDLHDGLGPTLAGVTLGLHAAQSTVATDPDRTVTLLATLETQVEDAVGDVRRLVYGLRPPALDEFGLCRALQQHAVRIERDTQLSVTVEAPDSGLGDLPAAVEVAAYRIATEAITNVSRHAGARTCRVRLNRDSALLLVVTDDGIGLAAGTPAGVGLTAMRERAAELGGLLSISSSGVGTTVSARLPIPEPS